MGTIHANSARQAMSKLRTYTLMAEEQLTPEVVDEMIAETIDLVVYLHLDQRSGAGGSRRSPRWPASRVTAS